MNTVSILVADDHAVVRRGLRALLETQPGWKIVGEASNGRDAVDKAKQLHPDVVILDVSMPHLNGLDAAAQILKVRPETRILMLTMHSDEELIGKTLSAGARGYILTSDAERDVVTAVEALLHGRTFFTSAASEVILRHLHRRPTKNETEHRWGGRLSPREREIVQLLVEGRANKEVASVLNISTRTVENHRAKIMEKLHLRAFSELVRYAIRNKIIEP